MLSISHTLSKVSLFLQLKNDKVLKGDNKTANVNAKTAVYA